MREVTVAIPEPPAGEHTLTVSVSGGGAVTLSEPGPSYPAGTEVKLTATWTPGTHDFTGWGGDCDDRDATDSSTDTTCELTMDGDRTATATFALKRRTLTVKVVGGGGNRGVNPSLGVHEYAHGTDVFIRARWDASTHSLEWTGACEHSRPVCEIHMDNDLSVTANFTPRGGPAQCTLTVDADPRPWAATVEGDWTGDCDADTDRTARVTPNAGFTVSSWNESACSGQSCTVAMDRDRDLVARLGCVGTRTLTTSAGPNGEIRPATASPTCDGAVTVTANADDDHRVDAWSGTGAAGCRDGETTCSVDMGGFDRSVHVTFECTGTRTLTTSAGSNGSISPGSGAQPCDGTVTVTADPDDGYQVDAWSGSGSGDCVDGEENCTVAMDGTGRSVHVTFECTGTRTLTTSAGSNGDVSPGSGAQPCDGTVTVTADPDDGYQVDAWSGSGSGDCVDGEESCSVDMDESDRGVHVTFRMCTLTVTAGTGGTVGGGGTYPCNSTQTAWATVSIPYFFEGWSGDSTSSARTISVYMDGDKSVHANYSPRDRYTIAVSVSPPYADIGVSPTGPYYEGYDTSVTLTVDRVHFPSYYFSHWEGDCSGTLCSLTMDGSKSVTAVLEEDCDPNIDCFRRRGEGAGSEHPPTLTYTVHGAGAITLAGPPTVPEPGSSFKMTLTASWSDATHEFAGWGGDCSGTASRCLLTIDDDAAVTAEIRELPVDRCASPTAADCIRAVYVGAPGDYAQVTDIPASALVAPTSDGRYDIRRGQQVTVVTAAPLAEGYTRFYLDADSVGPVPPVSDLDIILPTGTTYTFRSGPDADHATVVTFELTPGNEPAGEGEEPELGDAVVRTTFHIAATR